MKKSTPFLLLPLRLLLFAFFQGILALIFYFSKIPNPWFTAQGWWIIPALLTNIVTFILLVRYFNKKGMRYFQNFRFVKQDWWKDVLLIVAFLIVAGPVSILPGNILSQWLYGSPDATLSLFFRSVPFWVIITGFFWAVTQEIVELNVINNLQERPSHLTSTGVGLKNIQNRYLLLNNTEPVFEKSDTHFIAKIPLVISA